MKLSDYNYNLPDSLIADKPPVVRGTSRLLVLDKKSGNILDSLYSNIANYLKPGDLLILNNTKVIKARLRTVKDNGAIREIIILEKHSFDNDWHRHKILYRKKIRAGDILNIDNKKIIVESVQEDGTAIVRSETNLLDLVNKCGEVPLPPYMHRKATQSDNERYQTIWAKKAGSVAAPTASLNMTNEILESIKNKGANIAYITLHVGLGTFLPIRTENVEEHNMHQEYFEIPKETVESIIEAKKLRGRVIALGTTVARTLEYSNKLLVQNTSDISGEADIFIYPGYTFKVIDGLVTNYHAPKSTVLMLAAAFAGWDKLLNAYNHAIDEKYNFLSYGDSMLIL